MSLAAFVRPHGRNERIRTSDPFVPKVNLLPRQGRLWGFEAPFGQFTPFFDRNCARFVQVSADERKPIGAELEQELTSRPLPNLTQRRIGTTSSLALLKRAARSEGHCSSRRFFCGLLDGSFRGRGPLFPLPERQCATLGWRRAGGSVRFTYG